jgi:uncharacterized protein YdhG (YjbR/CyaY superfamily)
VVKPASVEEYLAALPGKPRAALERLRRAIQAAAPEAEEAIVYQMPGFRWRGRALAGYAAFKEHCSFFPMSARVVEDFAVDLAGYSTTKGSIHFTAEKPLPAALVKRIVRARAEEVAAKPGG